MNVLDSKCLELLRLQDEVFIGVCLVVKTNMLVIKFLKSAIASVCLLVVRENTVILNALQHLMTLLCIIKAQSTFIS